jgi:hypothetical protein
VTLFFGYSFQMHISRAGKNIKLPAQILVAVAYFAIYR